MKVAIIGGHLTPALAVLEHLPKNAQAVYIGRKYALEGDAAYSLEYQTIKSRNIPFIHISTGRLQRKITSQTLPSLLKLPGGFMQAYSILSKLKPDVLLGFGGYVQVPLGIVGKMLGIPLVIHEQTLEAGLANRVLAPLADTICVSWMASQTFFPKNKVVLTGNPAVSAIFEHASAKHIQKGVLPRIVIVGGSLGSHAINVLIEGCLEELLKNYEVVHQTGDAQEFADYERLSRKQAMLGPVLKERYTLTKFIDPHDIVSVFESADLVISRAGINTVTTLLLLNKPSLLIPLPTSQKNEQRKNALFLKQYGLGEVFDQTIGTPDTLLTLTHAMINNRKTYTTAHHTDELTIHKYAVQKIIDTLTYVAKKTPA